MQQAQRQTRAAPARGLRLPAKRPLSLLQRASAQTTRTRLRRRVVASIPRTLQSENPKAPARNAARALPDPPRPARQTAKPYRWHGYYHLASPFSFAWCVRPFLRMLFRSSMLVPLVLVPEEARDFYRSLCLSLQVLLCAGEVRLSTAVAASAVRGSLPILAHGASTDCRIPSLPCWPRLTTGGPAPTARPSLRALVRS